MISKSAVTGRRHNRHSPGNRCVTLFGRLFELLQRSFLPNFCRLSLLLGDRQHQLWKVQQGKLRLRPLFSLVGLNPSKGGRGFPDVSAQGQNVEIVSGGQTGTVDGTSCASPIFASVIGLLNDRLIAAGKSSLGFLNPFLYSAAGAAALTDITTGMSSVYTHPMSEPSQF